MPKKVYANAGGTDFKDQDQLSVYDVVQRVKLINRAFEKQSKNDNNVDLTGADKPNVSFINTTQ